MDAKATLRELSGSQPPPQVPDHKALRCIGRGSYGEVWIARNTLNTLRAVKVVFRNNFDDPRPYEREYSGIRAYEPVSRSHPGLVDILQVGRNDSEGYFYYVMELADPSVPASQLRPGSGTVPGGSPVGEIAVETYSPLTLRVLQKKRGRIPASEVVEIGLSLCGGLAALHSGGLIHRDIKPSNIIFVGGVAKLADIGLVTDEAEPMSYVGTEGFIPPEGPNSPQADLFSLGRVLYEAAMGKDRLDFPEPPSDLEELPDRDLLIELNSVLLTACQPDRRQRYATAEAMAADLRLLRQGRSVRDKRDREKRLKWMATAGVCLALVTAGAFGIDRLLARRAASLQGESSPIHPRLIGKISPRDPRLPAQLMDLSAAYTAPLTESWYPGPAENTLASLPRGLQTLAGTQFDIRGLVQLSGHEIATYGARYPDRREIWIDRWVDRLHFLHGALSEVDVGKVIGRYRILYVTGRTLDVPITFGRTTAAMWQSRAGDGQLPGATLAWQGQNPATISRDLELRLYKFTWANPRPKEQITSVEFSSAEANAAPFLVALTAEDARIPESEKVSAIDLAASLQEAARSFPALKVSEPAEALVLAPIKLFERPVELGAGLYDGFRFTVPPGETVDMIWGFHAATNSPNGWFILPMTGGMKVGFEDWYHVSTRPTLNKTQDEGEYAVQYISGRKLQPGREYFIWFTREDRAEVNLQAALRFVPAGRVDPNKPETLLNVLGLHLPGEIKCHRHYCLGSVR